MSGASYNGYDWRQRARIMSAFRRATGRREPFEGAPCSMCGDPDRAAGEWHSEEPFSYEPPESYPVCSSCHGRLHKRFNAPPGEWELFCLHLQSGGYGSEFVAQLTLTQRRALSRQLAEGVDVTLPTVRERPDGVGWWRNLTLDPESLNAPWARPRPLRPRHNAIAFADAFARAKMSEAEAAMLRAHANAPRRTMTMRAIAAIALASENPGTANLRYGTLARRLCGLLDWEPDKRDDGMAIWMSLLAEGWYPPGREFEWTMVTTAAEAALAGIPAL